MPPLPEAVPPLLDDLGCVPRGALLLALPSCVSPDVIPRNMPTCMHDKEQASQLRHLHVANNERDVGTNE